MRTATFNGREFPVNPVELDSSFHTLKIWKYKKVHWGDFAEELENLTILRMLYSYPELDESWWRPWIYGMNSISVIIIHTDQSGWNFHKYYKLDWEDFTDFLIYHTDWNHPQFAIFEEPEKPKSKIPWQKYGF